MRRLSNLMAAMVCVPIADAATVVNLHRVAPTLEMPAVVQDVEIPTMVAPEPAAPAKRFFQPHEAPPCSHCDSLHVRWIWAVAHNNYSAAFGIALEWTVSPECWGSDIANPPSEVCNPPGGLGFRSAT